MTVIWIAAGVVGAIVLVLAVVLGPDVIRYIRISRM